jgi:nitrate reductase cytochrome c-type subunit
VYSLSGTQFTGTVHGVLSVGDKIYRNCTQCTVCQGQNLQELYTVYSLSGTQFTGTVHSVLSVKDTFYWDCTQCTVCQGHILLGL